MNNVANINKFGAAKRPKKFRGPRGSEGGGCILANSLESIYACGLFCLLFCFLISSMWAPELSWICEFSSHKKG